MDRYRAQKSWELWSKGLLGERRGQEAMPIDLGDGHTFFWTHRPVEKVNAQREWGPRNAREQNSAQRWAQDTASTYRQNMS